jgi:EmrB/QacA subfamily drug resistance transporter
VVGTVCVGAFLGQLDASIATLILPTLEGTFRAPVADVEWVAIAYLVVLAALVVPFGRLADLVGRKLLYVAGFVVFIAGSTMCGFAPTLLWLIVFRILQAVGAAMLQANSVAIIAAAIERRRLGRAIGIQGAAQAIGLSLGPSIGGLLIDSVGWRWVFFIAVPFGVLGTVLAWFVLPRTSPAVLQAEHRAQDGFDWTGALLLGPAVALLMVLLTFGNAWGWLSLSLLGTICLVLACLGFFLLTERRASSPLVDLSLFSSRLFGVGILAGLLSYAVLFGSLFLLPFYLQRILGQTAAQTGLLLTSIPLALGVMAPIAGVLTDRVGSRLPTVVGMSLSAVALLCISILPAPGIPGTLGMLTALGIGLGMFTPPNNSAIIGSAPAHRLGTASGILNMTRSVGTSLGVALTGAILGLVLSAQSGQHVSSTVDATREVLQVALHETFLFLACMAGLAAALSVARGPQTAQTAPAMRAALTESIGV